MKTIILSLAVILLLVSCSQKANIQKPKRTVITGQVSNFETISEHDVIELICQDILAEQQKIEIKINKNGQFKYEPELDYPNDLFFLYGNGFISFYISPGDSLHFDISADFLKNEIQNSTYNSNLYKITGTAEKMNADFMKYILFSRNTVDGYETYNMITSSTPLEYKSYLQNLTQKRQEAANQFIKENNTCNQFNEWVKINIKFDEWNNLMRFTWEHPSRNRQNVNEYFVTIPEEYFDFLDDWDSENRNYLKSNNYLKFLSEYFGYVINRVPNKSLSQKGANASKSKVRSLKLLKSYVLAHDPGFVQDVMLAKLYYGRLDSKDFEEVNEIYSPTEISDELLAKKVQEKLVSVKEIYENPQFADGTVFNKITSDYNFLKTLTGKYMGKVIYIDFWAPWCVPCMAEMPDAAYLKKQFEGKRVAFVYLANQCTDDSWKSTIAEKRWKENIID